MRDIKFKAWLKDHKVMEFVMNLDLLNGGALVTADFSGNYGSSRIFAFKDIELMQYTGLKDKNGVEIYEGDVVVPFEPTKNGRHEMPVIWLANTGMWSLDAGYHGHYGLLSRFTDGVTCCSCEVIGNIHDKEQT